MKFNPEVGSPKIVEQSAAVTESSTSKLFEITVSSGTCHYLLSDIWVAIGAVPFTKHSPLY